MDQALVLILGLPGFWTPVKLALVTLLFLALLIGSPGMLSLHPLRVLGRLSYSIYLLQYLVIFNLSQIVDRSPRLAANAGGRLAMFMAMMAITVGVAALTYRLVELPWMRSGSPLGAPVPSELPSRAVS